ncbi:hypothetical protein [Aliikangiella coralliicola]|nr:hypothetical protein [Aliikangiella coralliicola]
MNTVELTLSRQIDRISSSLAVLHQHQAASCDAKTTLVTTVLENYGGVL